MHPLTHSALTEEEDHSGKKEIIHGGFLSLAPPLCSCFLFPTSLSRLGFLAVHLSLTLSPLTQTFLLSFFLSGYD